MAYITVTSHTNIFDIDFGMYGAIPTVGYAKRTFQKSGIGFGLCGDNSCVIVDIGGAPAWKIHYDSESDVVAKGEALVLESVNGVAPTSLVNLYQLLIDCLKTI